MKLAREFEFPADRQSVQRRAVGLEVAVIAFELTAIVLLYLVMGGSQAMRTAWIEDMLALIPPIVFLAANATRDWPPNDRYPYGYHRTVDIAFLATAIALLGFGLWLLIDGGMKLWSMQHPTIGTMRLLGWQVWQGWLMLIVLAYVGLVPPILGRLLKKPATQLHDKVLFAGSDMLKADWLSALAAAIGVLGIAVGWWWADAVAAMAISLSIIRDGVRNLRSVVGGLMDRMPEETTEDQLDPIPQQLQEMLAALDWVEQAEVRLREHGHVFFGEAFIVPKAGEVDLPRRIEQAVDQAYNLDWRVQDLVIHLVPEHGKRTQSPQVRSMRDVHRAEDR